MKIKTSELTGAALDWAVAKCEGVAVKINSAEAIVARRLYSMTAEEEALLPRPIPYCTIPGVGQAQFSTDWSQGGPLIEREGLELSVHIIHNGVITGWACEKDWPSTYQKGAAGPTPLIAAMRCFVASQLGDEVDVPEELT